MNAVRNLHTSSWKRIAGVCLGWLTQALFVFTVWRLFWFLKDGAAQMQRPLALTLSWDACLALQFAVPHSLLLLPHVKKRLTRFVDPAFYGLMFCIVTCLSLLLLVHFWGGSSMVVWSCKGWARRLILGCFAASWIALYYSISLTGLGYQTGYTPWTYWLRSEPVPRRAFVPRGAYRWLRHPVYLSFLGLIWFTPTMTVDHAVLTGIWTGYILVGSYLKDRRLAHYLGEQYESYAAAVPGYPLVPFGPLAKLA
jgi:protein-S-isoprenylcysteine O-methyltransferase Ste14